MDRLIKILFQILIILFLLVCILALLRLSADLI